jgi:peptidoglycan/LPS O-acetylase OafA/YrhL
MNVRSATVTPWPSRYELLDGLRGLAALAVVLHHLVVVADGHYAVMIFFVISGYCVTASADSCRRNRLGLRRFVTRRIKRIYPPYLLAIALFSLTRIVKATMGGPNDLQRPALDWIQNLTLTQWVSNAFHPIAWPSDNSHLFVPAFWSLNYEEQFYFAAAIALALATYKRIPLIAPVMLLAAIGLAWNFTIPGNWICGFFIEYWVHFALGACLYFVLCVYTDWRSRLAFVAGILLLGLASAARLIPWTATTTLDLRSMVEFAFLSVVTLSLFFLRPWSLRISRSMVWRPIAALGTISYSLYLIHQFNLNLVASIAQRMLPERAPHLALMVTMVGLHLGLATLFWYVCERPFSSKKAAAPGPIISATADAARIA